MCAPYPTCVRSGFAPGAVVLRYASSSHPNEPARGEADGRMRAREEKMHSGAMSFVGRPDAAFWGLLEEDRCRLGYIIGLTSSSRSGPCRILRWTSKFTRKCVDSSLRGKVYALSDTVGHMTLLREFYPPLVDIPPGMAGMEDCASFLTHRKTEKWSRTSI